jgi:hypothetical protein
VEEEGGAPGMWSPPSSLGGRVASGEWIREEREEKEKGREKKKGEKY